MKEWLTVATEYSILLIDAMVLIVIVGGTIECFFGGIRVMYGSDTGHERRDVWLRYARWLVAGLTFQLAADIIETSISPSWQQIGQVAAIAIVRTFLNYFLERDLTEIRDRQNIVQAKPPS